MPESHPRREEKFTMPTYEYQCDACQHNFDEFQGFSEAPLKKCPKCRKPKLRRVFGTGAAVLFKGSGFYQTDYRSESYKSAAKADQEATPKSTADSNSTNGTAGAGSTESGGSSKKSASKSSKSET
jgi:putative FmdB family regulatory protein